MRSAGNRGVVQSRLQMLHIHVFLVAPLGARHVARPRADQHQGRVAIGERPHHAGPAADLPIQPLLQQPQDQGKTEGLAACNSQTASPFGCLNNFYFKILSNFWGSLHLRVRLFLPDSLTEFAARKPRIKSNPFFAAACTSQKTPCAERVSQPRRKRRGKAQSGAKTTLSKRALPFLIK